MHQFFIDPEQREGNMATLVGEEARHLAKVLRLKPGDGIIIADGQGRGWLAQLTLVESARAVALLQEPLEAGKGEPKGRVVLVQGLPKGEKLELIIQKATELGAAAIQPVATERSIVRLEGRKAQERRERWQRVAWEAAKQCHRLRIPEVRPLLPWPRFLENLDQGELYLAWEGEGTVGLRQALGKRTKEGTVYLAVGPEGGWAPAEVELAREAGAVTVSLGSRILRTETAALASLAMTLYHWGDLG